MQIITDSAADFSAAELKEKHITCVPTSMTFGGETFIDGVNLTQEEFWARMQAGETGKTSQPSPDVFLSAFEKAVEGNEDVVCICVSSGVSGTLQSASIARSMLDEARIHIVDSLLATAAQKLLVLRACQLRDSAKLTAAETAEELRKFSRRIRMYACVDTLEYLARSGRLPQAAASLASLVHLKPLVTITEEGKLGIAGKGMGLHRATTGLIKLIRQHTIDRDFPVLPLFTCTADNCYALIRKLRDAGIPCREEDAAPVNTTISTHIGPGAFGVAFVTAE